MQTKGKSWNHPGQSRPKLIQLIPVLFLEYIIEVYGSSLKWLQKKVEAKGSTTYQEVADELVNECISGEMNNRSDAISSATKQVVEHKNIRRRVYDALNVLMAMDIIRKDKKLIHWQGLPDLRTGTGSEVGELEKEKTAREIEVNKKREALFKLLQQQVLFRNLVKHNREKQKRKGTPTKQTVSLPFCVVTYPGDTNVNIQVDPEQRDVLLQFDGAFQIYDDKDVLKKKNFDRATMQELQLMMPDDLFQYTKDTGLCEKLIKKSDN